MPSHIMVIKEGRDPIQQHAPKASRPEILATSATQTRESRVKPVPDPCAMLGTHRRSATRYTRIRRRVGGMVAHQESSREGNGCGAKIKQIWMCNERGRREGAVAHQENQRSKRFHTTACTESKSTEILASSATQTRESRFKPVPDPCAMLGTHRWNLLCLYV